MSREQALKRRRKAIQAARKAGLNDDEICEALHIKAEDLAKAEAIDVEVVEASNKVQDGSATKELALIGANTRGAAKPVDDGRRREYPTDRPGRDERNTSTDPEKVAAWDRTLAEHSEKRCTATNAKGKRCRRFAIPGGTVCKSHGGKARHVMNKARTRLEMASLKLVDKELEFALDDTKPAAVQLDAVKDGLNRVGIVKPVQLEVGPIKPYEEIFAGISEGLTRAESRRARGLEDDSDSVGLEDVTPLSSFNSEFYDATCDFTDDDCADRFRQPPAHGDPPTHTATGAAGSTHLTSRGGGSSQGTGVGRADVDSDHGQWPDDGPSARVRDDRTTARQSHRGEPVDGSRRPTKAVVPTVTGDDALAIAAALRRAQAARFADERGLPRGRSR